MIACLVNLRATLAASATFRTLIGASGDEQQKNDQALARIHYSALPKPLLDPEEYDVSELEKHRPYWIIWVSPQQGVRWSRVAVGGYDAGGSMIGRLVLDVPPKIKDNPAEMDSRFLDTINSIVADFRALAETAGYLTAETIEIEDGPYVMSENSAVAQGEAQGADIRFDWEGV